MNKQDYYLLSAMNLLPTEANICGIRTYKSAIHGIPMHDPVKIVYACMIWLKF